MESLINKCLEIVLSEEVGLDKRILEWSTLRSSLLKIKIIFMNIDMNDEKLLECHDPQQLLLKMKLKWSILSANLKMKFTFELLLLRWRWSLLRNSF